ncbi:MAG: His-Xaa-Ser system protein HxsD [Deltaproteobacteria bacterium]|nr:His-Xaa-Ser system protein HxsD [Deltaproteobacteria bacterium]
MSQEPQVKAESVDGVVRLTFEESIYPKDAVFGAAYVLLDRAFVHIDRNEGKLQVSVRPKPGVPVVADVIAGEFENEALAQTWRREIIHENRAMLESITSRALGGAAGPPGLDDLLDASLGDLGDAFDDPLGIAVSWEDKYGKKADGTKPEEAKAAAEASAEAQAEPKKPSEEPKP